MAAGNRAGKRGESVSQRDERLDVPVLSSRARMMFSRARFPVSLSRAREWCFPARANDDVFLRALLLTDLIFARYMRAKPTRRWRTLRRTPASRRVRHASRLPWRPRPLRTAWWLNAPVSTLAETSSRRTQATLDGCNNVAFENLILITIRLWIAHGRLVAEEQS